MNVYICSAARTAIGTYGGTLRDVPAAQLGIAAANAAVERAGVDKAAIDECLFGQVLQAYLLTPRSVLFLSMYFMPKVPLLRQYCQYIVLMYR